MTTDAAAAAGAVTDDEVRDWAKSTGRTVAERGRVAAGLRREYEMYVAELAGPEELRPALPAEEPAAGGAESPAAAPEPARAEQRPRPVRAKRKAGTGARLRAFLAGAPPARTPAKTATRKQKADPPPRQPIATVIASGWDRFGQWVANVHPPVGRTLSWQADYAGMVAEELLPNTPVDRVLQPLMRARGKVGAAGAIVATPIIVGMLGMPSNQPDTPAGAAKHKLLMTGLEDCIRAQLKYLGGEGRAEKLEAQQQVRAAEQAEVDAVLRMIWAPEPGSPEAAAMEQQAQAAAAAQQAQAAAQAVRFMAPAPGFMPGQHVSVVPDLRGEGKPVMPAGRPPLHMRIGDDGRLVPDG